MDHQVFTPSTPPALLPAPVPVEELILLISKPAMVAEGGKQWGRASVKLQYKSAHGGTVRTSPPFTFEAPLGPIELEELSWYLERFSRWPGEAFKPRAKGVENKLSTWGRELFQSALDYKEAIPIRYAWEEANKKNPRRFTVRIEELHQSDEAGDPAVQKEMAAAAHLLALPWELLHDGRRFLFQGLPQTRVRRQLPNYFVHAPLPNLNPPLRVLLLSPRPEDKTAGYLDHRVTALPMAEALAELGAMAELTVLADPSFVGLTTALREAEKQEKPFHVVHFDGHGVYLQDEGVGALCFEEEDQQKKLYQRATRIVQAEELAQELTGFRIPFFFLDACQGAQAEMDPASSVAAKLLDRGVAAVAAMSHSVLVITAKAFVTVFYQRLAKGERVGEAMLAGQRQLFDHKKRGHYLGAGELELHDWFVPVLYQEGEDFPLVVRVLGEEAQELAKKQHQAHLGRLLEPPPHQFVGRSRELLAIERLLLLEKYGVLLGEGGEGKTALACEAARWLATIHRVGRVAFVSLETNTHFDAVLDVLGKQLVGKNYGVATFPDVEQALLPVEQALREEVCLLVLDNMETILPPRLGSPAVHDSEELAKLLALFQRLQGVGKTRLLFTSRERLPAPFDAGRNHVDIGRLAPWDGVELVKNVLQRAGVTPFEGETIDKEKTLLDLVNAVHGHARTLVMLAPELVRMGVPKTTENLHHLMASLEKKHPGERERSLYAGVALSLNRLTPATRQAIRLLGVFQGGGHLVVIGDVLGIQEPQELVALAGELAKTGLCDIHENGYLTFHFALCSFLWGEMSGAEQESARQCWLAGEYEFAGFLHGQRSQDAQLAAALTLLDLANLLAGLEQAALAWPVERALDWASSMASLLQHVGSKAAQGQVAAIREGLASRLGAGWSHVRFKTELGRGAELASQGRQTEAQDAAMRLLDQALAAGEGAYAEAPYDLALAYFSAGRYTKKVGNATAAIPLLQESRARFQSLATGGDQDARKMATAALNDLGDCQRDLGQLEAAAKSYQLAVQESEQVGDLRGVAVSQIQLGTVRMLQRRYPEALDAYEQARQTFTQMQELASVATSWYQTGMVYQNMREWARSEAAYRQSLEINTNLNNQSGVANTLDQLGQLFAAQNRLEEAVVHYRNAATIRVRQGDLAGEGRVRGNLSFALQQLNRLGEARQEIQRAMECDKPFGHAAEPWKSYVILANIETAAGQPQAAGQARRQARQLFGQYRRDGGENHQPGAQLCQITAAAIQQGEMAQARQEMEESAQDPKQPPWAQALAPVLISILNGQRQPELADSAGLTYDNAVEVELLLEQLA